MSILRGRCKVVRGRERRSSTRNLSGIVLPTIPSFLGSATPASPSLGSSGVSRQYDLVLSSGFLAFAHHAGFLQAVEDAELEILGVMGTSAGALAGSLYCAGYSPRQIAMELSRDPPIKYLQPSGKPWEGGIISIEGVIERLRELLPPRFEDLDRELAVGVVTAQGDYLIIDHGPLPEAVAASAAVPFLFQNVHVPGLGDRNPCKDGGMIDRVGLKGWRDRRRSQLDSRHIPPCLVHIIHRSTQFSGSDDVGATGEKDITTIYSPKSGVNLLNLGDFEDALQESVSRSTKAIKGLSSKQKFYEDTVQESNIAYNIKSLDNIDGTSMDIVYDIDDIQIIGELESVDTLEVIDKQVAQIA